MEREGREGERERGERGRKGGGRQGQMCVTCVCVCVCVCVYCEETYRGRSPFVVCSSSWDMTCDRDRDRA